MLACLLVFSVSAFAKTGSEIVEDSGIRGGLIVHIGCGDAQLTRTLQVNDRYLVQGLDRDETAIQATRRKLLAEGMNVSVSGFDGKNLPYVDNLVNLVVSENLGAVAMEEVMRVLAPDGVAYIKEGQNWRRTVKPVPADTDEWTHYLHGADNNAVSRDQQVHSPKHLKWVGSPRYSRHHDHMSAMGACVTAGGKIYHTMDESSRLSIYLRPTWKLVGRDAYNGVILWKRDITEWYSHMQRLKSGPAYLPRKLVAIGDILYASLGIHEPLSVIDGATGKTLKTYVPDMETDEILYSEGVLYLVGSAKDKPNPTVDLRAIKGEESRRLVAVNADNGEILWEFNSKILPLTLTLGAGQVYLHDTNSIVALDTQTGEALWKSEPLSYWKLMQPMFAPTLVTYKDVVFFAGGATFKPHRGSYDQMYAISAKDGKTLWKDEHPPSGYQSPEDILIVDDLVWCAATTSGNLSGELIGRDPWTGEEKKRFPSNVDTYWFHHRCYRAKATDNYFLMSRTGVEFVDYKKEDWEINHWVRGACLYGVMPANGTLYAPQHPCACYPEVKLNGFSALTSHRQPANTKPANRLVKGAAYGAINHQQTSAGQEAWPTFRHDASRSGSTTADIPNALKESWTLEIGGRLSQPVLAGGRLFVAEVDRHAVHAIDEASGRKLWTYVAGGRIDSPPTLYRGSVLFGSNDGWVYCVRAADGELAWKFLAAPRDMKHMAFEQVESVWPVPGNILIENDTAYFVAGRNIFLDGGLHLYRLNPVTGEMLSDTLMSDTDPDGKPIQDYIDWLNMPVGRPDILSSNGKHVYMCSQPFDMQGKRTRIDRLKVTDQRGEDAHLFCPSGFLDDSWWHRTYQVYGQSFSGGHSGYHRAGRETPCGKLMVFDDEYIYSFGRKPEYYKWTTPIEHQLFSVDKKWTLGTGEPKGEQQEVSKEENSMIRFEVTDSLDPVGKSLAVEAWVKPGRANANGVILARGGPSNGYALVLRKGKPEFMIRTDGYVYSVVATEKVRARWVHIAGVLTAGKELKLYINGKLNNEGEETGPISAIPLQGMEIGADDAGSVGDYKAPFLFKGSIDDVRVYHGALSAAEIMAHMKSEQAVGTARAELVLHCTFNDGKAADGSGQKNHGTLTNSVTPTKGKGRYGQALAFAGNLRQQRGRSTTTAFPYRWKQELPLFVRAMVKTADKLIIAGPEDIIDEEKVKVMFTSPEMQVRLDKQSAILAGERGGILRMVSTEDGQQISEYKLDVPPIFDGMIAANGKLFISTMDGSLVCLTGK